MKPRKASALRELTDDELLRAISEAQETLQKQRFQHSLSQLEDSAYLNILRKDIARMITLAAEKDIML
jgi:large subunit ribosomal protein L29